MTNKEVQNISTAFHMTARTELYLDFRHFATKEGLDVQEKIRFLMSEYVKEAKKNDRV